MPTYQYACTECGHAFDQVQSFSDASLTVCPACDGKLRKVFNAVGVVFKGSGFYRNDSRSASSTSDAPAAKSSDSKDSGTSTTKDSGTKSTGTKESASASSGSSSNSSGSSSTGSSAAASTSS